MDEIKYRRIYVKKDGRVVRYLPNTNRKVWTKIRACSGQGYRILIGYQDKEKKYRPSPINDSGWVTNKNELLKCAKAFLDT